MPMQKRVSTVRYHGEKVTVEWTEPNGQDQEECKLECEDAPQKSFVEAMEALTEWALKLVEIPKKAWPSARVIKVNLKRKKGGQRAVILTLHHPLEHGSATVNTPLRQERTEEDQAGAGFMDPKLLEAVLEVQKEALAYVDGEREQGDLFKDGEEKEEKTA